MVIIWENTAVSPIYLPTVNIKPSERIDEIITLVP